MAVNKKLQIMKLFNFKYPTSGILPVTIMAIVMLSMPSCAKKMAFLSSSVVPAARGEVKIKSDNNKNHVINVSITNLAEPERLTPPKQMYMVWMLTDQNSTKNLGQIKTSDGTFSKTLKASFETVTTFKPLKIFITAENDSNVQYPDRVIILTTSQFQN
jgi:hypothetical protein